MAQNMGNSQLSINQKNLKRGLRINVHVYFHKIPILVEIRNLFDFEHPDFERYIWFLSF